MFYNSSTGLIFCFSSNSIFELNEVEETSEIETLQEEAGFER